MSPNLPFFILAVVALVGLLGTALWREMRSGRATPPRRLIFRRRPDGRGAMAEHEEHDWQ